MNSDWKQRWVEALRSGQYLQGKGCLRHTDPDSQVDQYCCLGVLTNIVAQEFPEQVRWKRNCPSLVWYVESSTTTVSGSFLPDEVANIANLDSINPVITMLYRDQVREVPLATLNDKEDLSFSDIADLIEAQL